MPQTCPSLRHSTARASLLPRRKLFWDKKDLLTVQHTSHKYRGSSGLMSPGSCLSPLGTFDRLPNLKHVFWVIPKSGCGRAQRPLLPALKMGHYYCSWLKCHCSDLNGVFFMQINPGCWVNLGRWSDLKSFQRAQTEWREDSKESFFSGCLNFS